MFCFTPTDNDKTTKKELVHYVNVTVSQKHSILRKGKESLIQTKLNEDFLLSMHQ